MSNYDPNPQTSSEARPRGRWRWLLSLAVLAVAIRWKGGDWSLSPKSGQWIIRWLVGHGASEKEIEAGCGGPRRDKSGDK